MRYEVCRGSLQYRYDSLIKGVIQYGYVFRFLTHTSGLFHI